MQVLFPAAGGWNFFYTPKVGDQVVVNRLPNGAEEGYIIGKVYTANKMPQGGAKDIFLMVSDDGKNIVRFDADKGTLDLICDQKAALKFKNLDIEVEEHTHIKTKTFHVEAEEWIEVEAGKTIDTISGEETNISAGKDINTLSGANTNITATANVTVVGANINLN
ncbi:MAG: hypothetical protein LBQ88_11600 [Treponema sp.]|nr:hypothetical protein [Treponema sp.]